MTTEEEWRPLYTYEETHRISNTGRVIGNHGYDLKIHRHPSWQLRVSVRSGGRAHNINLAAYVLYSFGYFPEAESHVSCYRDNDQGDVNLANLYWGVPKKIKIDKGPCPVETCDRRIQVRGLCLVHHHRRIHGRELTRPIISQRPGEWGQWRVRKDGYARRSRKLKDGTREEELQHRQVMEEYLNRRLLTEETVHHINGVRYDNRIENLELWSSSHPPGQRVPDKVAWAVEIIKQYQPELLKEEI